MTKAAPSCSPLELIKAAIDREAEPWEDTGDHPITASVRELARRVRVEMLRAGGREWADDEVAIFGGNLNETAVIASFVIIARLAQLKGCLRVYRAAATLADMALWNSAHLGRFRRKVEIAEQMPPWWRELFVPIIRNRFEYDRVVLPGGDYVRVTNNGQFQLCKRAHA